MILLDLVYFSINQMKTLEGNQIWLIFLKNGLKVINAKLNA